MISLRPVRASIVTLAAVTAIATVAARQAPPSPAEWRYFGADKSFTRYSALDRIDRNNVGRLRIAWQRPAVNAKLMAEFPDLRPNAYLRATPIAVNGVLFTQDAHGLVIALDGETGRTIWEQRPFGTTSDELAGASTRGVDYWVGPAGPADRRIFAIRGEYLYAVDAATGGPVPRFGEKGRVHLRFGEGQPLAGRFNDSTGPIVVRNVVVVAGNTAGAGDGGNTKEAAPEDVRGYDAETGKHLWTFHVVPRPGEFGNETWGNGSWKFAGDLGAWNPMTADEDLGYVYVPLSAPTAAWYGGWRPGDNLFSNSIVALDARTGRRVWHFQTVHHDLWDWDNIGPPMLIDITVEGRRIKALAQANKAAFLYVLDRATGAPVWPIEERPVPQSTVPGERSSPTQPFPTKPLPFDLQGISDADLIDYTPALKERARSIARQYVMGPVFTPPSVPSDRTGGPKGTLVQPGAWGSANWNTGAFDPDTSYYYAISQTLGPANRAAWKQTDKSATMEYADFMPVPTERAGQPASQSPPSTVDAISIDGLPIIKGPYGRITAIDLNRGEHVWMKPNGDGPRSHVLLRDLNLPPLGYPNRPAPLLTKTLLFLGEGSNAISGTAGADWTWGKKFRAYDKATGAVIWETTLPSGTTAGPMTYLANGRQFIVVSVGARDHQPEYVALALP